MTVRFTCFRHGSALGAAAALFSLSVFALIWFSRGQEHTTARTQTIPIGWRMKSDAPACLSKGYLDKLLAFVFEKDELGFKKAMALGLTTDQCRWFASGQPVFVDKSGGRFGNPCVRVRGDTECWYVLRDNLEMAD